MIKRTLKIIDGKTYLGIKFYPALSSIFYGMLLLDLNRLKIKK